MNAIATEVGADAQQWLTFKLAGEEYGVGILSVQEIRGWSAVTAIPHSPAWLLGVINLRGAVVPIIDLRIKFNFAKAEYNEFTVVIILTVAGRVLGIVVDGVSDVTTLEPGQIKPAPEFSAQQGAGYIIGLGTQGERMLILIDIEKLIAGRDMGLFDAPAAALAA